MKWTRLKESISKIASVFSTGDYFIHFHAWSIKSIIVEFFTDLKKYIKNNQNFRNKNISIILDNAHTQSEDFDWCTKREIRQIKFHTSLHSAICPCWAFLQIYEKLYASLSWRQSRRSEKRRRWRYNQSLNLQN